MKKSEFIEIEKHKILALLREARAPRPVIARTLAEVSASSAEASGVQWEPEELDLPARVSWCPARAVAVVVGNGDRIALDLSLVNAKYPEDVRRWTPFLMAALDAYNFWGPKGEKREKLRRLAAFLRERAGWGVATVLGDIEALLDEGGDVG